MPPPPPFALLYLDYFTTLVLTHAALITLHYPASHDYKPATTPDFPLPFLLAELDAWRVTFVTLPLDQKF